MCKELLYVLEGYNHIALFASLDYEIDTTSLLEELLKTDKHIYLPKVVGKDIRFYEVKSLDELVVSKDKYHIREPRVSDEINKDIFEVIICPGIAFTHEGNRLGHGKGFYDRYLADYHGYKIGICYKEQLVENIPMDEYDIKMNAVFAY